MTLKGQGHIFGQMDGFIELRRQKPIGKGVFTIILRFFYYFEKLAKNIYFNIFKLTKNKFCQRLYAVNYQFHLWDIMVHQKLY